MSHKAPLDRPPPMLEDGLFAANPFWSAEPKDANVRFREMSGDLRRLTWALIGRERGVCFTSTPAGLRHVAFAQKAAIAQRPSTIGQ